MTLDGEEFNLLDGSLESDRICSPPPPPRNEGVSPTCADVCVGEVIVLGSRTLIVTSLLGVRLVLVLTCGGVV